MKPGKPLQRHTRLVGKPEKHDDWQRRSRDAAIQRARATPQRRPVHTPTDVRTLVIVRSVIAVGLDPDDHPAGLCELCGTEGTNTHTRRPNGMGGTKRPETYRASDKVRVCGQGNLRGIADTWCHGRIEGERAWALNRGLLLKQSQNPAELPVRLRYGLVLLDDQGGFSDYEGAAA